MKRAGETKDRLRQSRIALKITCLYLLAAGLWILLSDYLLPLFAADVETLSRLQTVKGWIFVALSGLLLYLLIHHNVGAFQREEEAHLIRVCSNLQTGLPNEQLFRQRLKEALTEAGEQGRELEVMYIDFDRFRSMVRAVGHSAGQKLLQDIGKRLVSSLGPEETLAQVVGDEFVCMTSGVDQPTHPTGTASRFIEALESPFTWHDQSLHLTASIGIAVYPHDGEDGETLLRHAYAAMCRAKDLGGNNFQFYFPQFDEVSAASLALENQMRQALESEEFELRYQPQVELSSGLIVGMEALVSWKHPEHPGMSPTDFIPLAELTGLIEPMGRWILRAACAQNRSWQEAGHPPLRVAVNVSARQFYRTNLADLVREVLAETGLQAEWLELEITESILLQDIDEAAAVLKSLKEIGVRISIDDFGTGYSSLSYLKRLPVDKLKLDRTFVDDLPHDPNDAAISAAVIAMAHVLGISVLAEGVEREEQREYLKEKGCDQVQGFLYSQPLPAEEFGRLVGLERKVREG